MVKKIQKTNRSFLLILLIMLGISVFLFGVVLVRNNQISSSNVKGESTASLANPASVYCKNQKGTLQIKTDATGAQSGWCSFSDGRYCEEWEFYRTKICNNPIPKNKTAKEGEACGKSVNKACLKDLICAPLGLSYKLLNGKTTETESLAESESVSEEQRLCVGKTENEIKGGCIPYIPYYGACVKKGVWPPPSLKPTPTGTMMPTPISTCIPKPPCVNGVIDPKTGSKIYCDPKPGTVFCTPTPTGKTTCYPRPIPCTGTKCPNYSPLPPGVVLCTPTPTPTPSSVSIVPTQGWKMFWTK